MTFSELKIEQFEKRNKNIFIVSGKYDHNADFLKQTFK